MEAPKAATLRHIPYHNVYEASRASVALKAAVLAPLRRGILADGSIQPRILARWRAEDAYGPALRAIDDVSPGFSASFGTSAQATNAISDAAFEHRSWFEGFQRQAAANALSEARAPVVEPAEVEPIIGGLLATGNGATRMRELVKSVAAEPDALAGLRRGAVCWIVRRHLGTPSLIRFLTDTCDALRELFPHSQVTMFFSVARSIEMDIRSVTEPSMSTGPTMAFVAVMGFLEITVTAHSVRLGTLLRQAGIRDVEALYREMLFDRELARLMIGKMPRSLESSKWHSLTRVVRRTLITAPLVNDTAKKR